MRAVVQRVTSASVAIDGQIIARIDRGLLVLLGVQNGDTPADAAWLAHKLAHLRIFEDAAGKMNLSVLDPVPTPPASDFIKPEPETLNPEPRPSPASAHLPSPNSHLRAGPAGALVVSQFTLLASTRKGHRPSFNDAAKPELAIPLYEGFVREFEILLGRPVATGTFGAMMQVALVNDGPVTLVLDSRLKE